MAGMEVGRAPRTVALDVVGRTNKVTGRREGGILGLSGPQTEAVLRARAQLASGDVEQMQAYLTRARRDKRFDPLVKKAIMEGRMIAAADVERVATRYSERLLKLRGETIARNEALSAMAAGQYEGLQQLVDSGKVQSDQIMLTWSATPDSRTRDTHRALNGTKIRFGESFVTPSGAMMKHPHDLTAPISETIQCRCFMQPTIKYL